MQDQNIDTVLGDDIVFRGRLQFKKELKINGRFKGTITTPGQLIIGSGASVEADVEAGIVTVQGDLTGNILATKSIELKKSGHLHGDLRTPDLQVESGARFTGSSTMD